MGKLTDAMREHHRALLDEIATAARAGTSETSQGHGDLERLVALLRDDLLPHAHGEEGSLYPAVDPLVAAHGRPTATMSVDHEWIQRGVADVVTLATTLAASAPGDQATVRERMRERLTELLAILRLHVEKEERVYFPLLDAHVPDAEQERMLRDLHDS